jgi:hypothetical protein
MGLNVFYNCKGARVDLIDGVIEDCLTEGKSRKIGLFRQGIVDEGQKETQKNMNDKEESNLKA